MGRGGWRAAEEREVIRVEKPGKGVKKSDEGSKTARRKTWEKSESARKRRIWRSHRRRRRQTEAIGGEKGINKRGNRKNNPEELETRDKTKKNAEEERRQAADAESRNRRTVANG